MTAALAWSAAPVSTAANPSGHSATVDTADPALGSSMGVVTLSSFCIAFPILGWRATPRYLQTLAVGIGENRDVSGRRQNDPGRVGSQPGRRPRNGPTSQHPGAANYPAGDDSDRRTRRPSPMPSANRYLPPLGQQPQPDRTGGAASRGPAAGERITVTRAAALRSREMGSRMYWMVQRAATADGADKSGLTALTWPVVANFAVDAAMGVALANTLFFAAASGESKSKVALYLLITIAPFAVIAPLIGPALDRVQHGRRVALATSFALRTALAVVLIAYYANGSFPPWVLYPCALGMMVL